MEVDCSCSQVCSSTTAVTSVASSSGLCDTFNSTYFTTTFLPLYYLSLILAESVYPSIVRIVYPSLTVISLYISSSLFLTHLHSLQIHNIVYVSWVHISVSFSIISCAYNFYALFSI